MKSHRIVLTVALPLLVAQACASYHPSDEVTAQMTRTEVLIQQADRSGVGVDSLPELQAAKDKYARAQASLAKQTDDGDRMALQLARQAELDTQYATARAQSTSESSAAKEVQNGVDALKKEADRNAAPVTTAP